jgi:hypothetical protein
VAQIRLVYFGWSVGNPGWVTQQGSLNVVCAGGETLVVAFNGFRNSAFPGPTDSNGTFTKQTAAYCAKVGSATEGGFFTQANAAAGLHVITPPPVAGGEDGNMAVWLVTGMPATLAVRTAGKTQQVSASQTITVTTTGSASVGDPAFGMRWHENSVVWNPTALTSPPSGGWIHDDAYINGGINLPTEACHMPVGSASTVSATWVTDDPNVTDTGAAILVLTPTSQVSIVTPPGGQAAAVGATATFTVSAIGATGYQWQVSTDGGQSFANVSGGSGGTTASYTTPTVVSGDNLKQYRCVLTDGTNPVTSAPALFTIPGVSSTKGRYRAQNGWAAKARARRQQGDRLLRKQIQPDDLNGAEAAVWGDWFFGTAAPTSVSLSSSQSVPDAVLTATAAAKIAVTSSQSVPDAALTATALAAGNLSSAQAVPDATLVATAVVRASASSTQSVPDAALSATVHAVASLSSTQSVPDAALTATVGTWRALTSTQTVPLEALTATAHAVDSLSATQTVPDAALSAAAGLVAKLSATQLEPDAALSARIGGGSAITSAQAVPDATLVASAAARVAASSTQVVADAALVATSSAIAKVVSTQTEADALLSARIGSGSGIEFTQQEPDAALVATATVRVALSRSQIVPDAVTVATAHALANARSVQIVQDALLDARASNAAQRPITQRVPDATLWARVSHVYPSTRPTPPSRTLAIAGVDRTLVVRAESP